MDKVCKHGHINRYGMIGKQYLCIACRRISLAKSSKKLYHSSPARRKAIFDNAAERKALNPLKVRARDLIRQSVRRGRIIRPPECERCQKVAVLQAEGDVQ